jgi:hypothetical protein
VRGEAVTQHTCEHAAVDVASLPRIKPTCSALNVVVARSSRAKLRELMEQGARQES